MITLENVTLAVGGKFLLADANCSVVPGSRIGVVGRNGCGKSHVLYLLAGTLGPDMGQRKVVPNTTVLLVEQELPSEDQSPIDFLRETDPDLIALQNAMESCDANDIGDISDQLVMLEDERYTVLAPKVLKGLGLTEAEVLQPMRHLSGGLRMRVNLAAALVRQPDVLLLDEPTNHLDLEATQWLISYLNTYNPKAAIVVVTHNTRLLEAVTTSTLHLRQGELTQFNGTYALYRKTLAAREVKDSERNAELEKQIARHREIYMRFRDLPAKRAAQAKSQLRRAEEKESQLVEILPEEPVVTFSFSPPETLKNPIICLQEAKLGYGTREVLDIPQLDLPADAKIALIGRNGEGKSTLIKALVGKLALLTGTAERNPRLRIGYFSQDLMDELEPTLTVATQFMTKTGLNNETQVRSVLSQYGFPHEKISVAVGDLSGGERSRLLFAIICARTPHLIILDEPTNHLDVESNAALVEAIRGFRGAVVLVSHDGRLLQDTMREFWLVSGGKVQIYKGGLAAYEKELQRFISQTLPQTTGVVPTGPGSLSMLHRNAGSQSKQPVPQAAMRQGR